MSMATRVQVTFDAADPARLAAFWAETLHYVVPEPPAGFATWDDWARAEGIPEADWNRARAIVDPDGVGPRIYFQRVPEPKTAKNRMHFDVNAGGGQEVSPEVRRANVDAEVARLTALGASDARGPRDEYGSYWVRLNDPEGNEFCVQ
jgi:hypothetical protein